MEPYFSKVLSDYELDKFFKAGSNVGVDVNVFDGGYFVSDIDEHS